MPPPTYKHLCGATVDSVAEAFVHLLECPLELAKRDPDWDRAMRDRGQRVDRADVVTRYARL